MKNFAPRSKSWRIERLSGLCRLPLPYLFCRLLHASKQFLGIICSIWRQRRAGIFYPFWFGNPMVYVLSQIRIQSRQGILTSEIHKDSSTLRHRSNHYYIMLHSFHWSVSSLECKIYPQQLSLLGPILFRLMDSECCLDSGSWSPILPYHSNLLSFLYIENSIGSQILTAWISFHGSNSSTRIDQCLVFFPYMGTIFYTFDGPST